MRSQSRDDIGRWARQSQPGERSRGGHANQRWQRPEEELKVTGETSMPTPDMMSMEELGQQPAALMGKPSRR